MAIYFPLSKFELSQEMNQAPGATILAEGVALVRSATAQSQGVMPSTGTPATDRFVGFAVAGTSAAPFPEAYQNKVETFNVLATGTVTLAQTPISGQVFVFNDTTGAAITPAPTVTGNTITGLPSGNTVTVTYKFAMSVVQARSVYGDVQPGGYSGNYVGQIGVVTRGTIFTSEFDASANWSAAQGVKLAASGQLTALTAAPAAGDGHIPAVIVALPTQETPYLGIQFDFA